MCVCKLGRKKHPYFAPSNSYFTFFRLHCSLEFEKISWKRREKLWLIGDVMLS